MSYPCSPEFSAAEYAETRAETLDQLREFQSFLEKSLSGDMTLVDQFGAAQLAIQAAGTQETQHSTGCKWNGMSKLAVDARRISMEGHEECCIRWHASCQKYRCMLIMTCHVHVMSCHVMMSSRHVECRTHVCMCHVSCHPVSDAFRTPEVIRMFALQQPDQLRLRHAQLQRDVKLGKLSREQYQRQAVEILVALKRLNTALTTEETTFLESMSSAAQLESAVDNVGSASQSQLINTASAQIARAKK